MVGSSVGPYLIVERLGAGGMGEVYLGFDTRLKRHVALKSLSASPRGGEATPDLLLREARAAAGLSHPNIAAIHDVLESGPRPCIVMEYVQGETLASRAERGPMPCSQALAVGIQLADALAHAHQAGIVHGDLKPGNVMLTPDGVAKVLDFGLATWRPTGAAGKGLDESLRDTVQAISGTPAYMAPERLLGHAATTRGDVYGLGVLLFELLAGRRPYEANDFMSLALSVVSGPTPVLEQADPSIPADISRVVARAMAKEPGDRHETAAALAAELRRLDAGLHDAVTVSPDARVRPVAARAASPVPVWWRRAILLGAAAVVAAVVVALLFAQGWVRWPSRSLPDRLVIGVLPLANLTGDETRDYVGVGISESLITSLAALPAVTVVSGNETGVKRTDDARAMARRLGATVLLTGSVLRASGEIGFSVKLLKADGTVIWAREYQGPPDAQFQMQRSVASEAAAALALSPTPAEQARMSSPPSSSVDAYAEYSKGRALLDRPDVPGRLDAAIASFQRAIEQDGGFALAHAAMGDAWWAKYLEQEDPAYASRSLASIERAVAIDPASARTRVSLANVQLGTGKVKDAVAVLREVVAAHPNDDQAHRLLARALGMQGDVDGALAEFQQAIAVRPDYWRNHSALGSFYQRQGRYAEAAMAFQRVTEILPDSAWGFGNLGAAYHAAGDKERALKNYERALAITPDDAITLSNVGAVLHSQGRYEEAADAFKRAAALAPRDAVSHANLGDAYAKLGRQEDARAAYRRAVDLGREQLKVNARDAQQLSRCALYLAKLGERAEAVKFAREAVAAAAAGDVEVFYRRAAVHALLGQAAESVEWLERAIGEGYSLEFARADDDLASIRALPRVQALLKAGR